MSSESRTLYKSDLYARYMENLRKSGAIVCGNITMGNHAATAYWKPFMLLTTTARSSLFPAQTSLAQE